MKSNILLKSIVLSLMIVSLSACGGGGGGGGGSSGGGTPIIPTPELPNFDLPNIDITSPNTSDGGNVVTSSDGTINFSKEESSTTMSRKGDVVVGAKGNGKIVLKKEQKITIEDTGKNSIDNKFSLDGYSFGIYSKSGEVTISSTAKIILKGDSIVGIYGDNSQIINNGTIQTDGNTKNVIGIFGNNMLDLEFIKNNGTINLSGDNAIGIKLYNATATNNGTITIDSQNGIGMSIVGEGSAINNEIININGNGMGIYSGYGATGRNNETININGNGYGMYADNGGYIYNEGIININNNGYGMYVKDGGYALNEGVINLSSQANGGMIADGNGSIVENKGTINVDSNSSLTKDKIVTAINGGKVLNSGNIIFKDKATIYSVDGLYTIGTSQDGDYGKVIAENIEINGNVAIDSGIAKGSYRDDYTLEGVFEGKVEFGDEYKVMSDSLLYDANIIQGENGNYDGKLIRNDKIISDFISDSYVETSKVFDKYFSENEYNTLSENGKNLIDSINIENENILKANIKDLTPTIYANNGRAISNIGDSFKEQREKTILSLGDYNYNFSFIGNVIDVDSKEIIEGYKSQMTGFVGTTKISDKNYLSLGYAYTDIDYSGSSNGNVHSIHLGVDGSRKYDLFKFEYGIGGEYNIHEIEREMKSYNMNGKSDFNSYGLKTYGKISNLYSSIVEIEPYIALDLGYYYSEEFDEKSFTKIKIDSEDYISVNPKLGFNIAKKFTNLKFYGGMAYSYELGNMDKKVEYSYDGIANKVDLRDKQEAGLLNTKIGVEYTKYNFTFILESGKNFGRRDNSFINGSIGYRF